MNIAHIDTFIANDDRIIKSLFIKLSSTVFHFDSNAHISAFSKATISICHRGHNQNQNTCAVSQVTVLPLLRSQMCIFRVFSSYTYIIPWMRPLCNFSFFLMGIAILALFFFSWPAARLPKINDIYFRRGPELNEVELWAGRRPVWPSAPRGAPSVCLWHSLESLY